MPDTSYVAIEFVMAKLRARAALSGVTVVAHEKPSDVDECIVVRLMSGGVDHIVLAGHIVRTDPVVSVFAIRPGDSPTVCRAWAEEIFTALHQASGSTSSGGFVHFCRRISPVSFAVPNESGVTEQCLGGNYRLEVKGDD